MSTPPTANRSPSKPPKVAALQNEALSLIGAHRVRLQILARAAFGNDPDPLALYGHELSQSALVHVQAFQLLQEAHVEWLKVLDQERALRDAQRSQPSQPPLPFPGVLSLLGIVPIDTVRFRNGTIALATSVALAVFGLGVLVAKAGVLVGKL